MKQQILKRIDLLVRENSEATKEDIQQMLDKIFKKIANKSNDKKEYVGYGTVFDARNKTYIWVYSDRAKEIYGLTKTSYEVIPEGIVTKNNYLSYFMLNLSLIVTALKEYFTYGKYYIKTLTTKVLKDNKIDLKDTNVQGDVVNDTALVVVKEENENKVYEEFVITLDEKVAVINDSKDLEGLEVMLTCMVNEEK